MITVTVQQLMDSVEVLQRLISFSFPARTAFHIARLAREIDKEFNLLQKTRLQIIEQYGERDDEGQLKDDGHGTYLINKTDEQKFLEEYNEWLQTSIDVNIEPLQIDWLADAFSITPKDMMRLEPFIKE